MFISCFSAFVSISSSRYFKFHLSYQFTKESCVCAHCELYSKCMRFFVLFICSYSRIELSVRARYCGCVLPVFCLFGACVNQIQIFTMLRHRYAGDLDSSVFVFRQHFWFVFHPLHHRHIGLVSFLDYFQLYLPSALSNLIRVSLSKKQMPFISDICKR